MGEMTTKRDYSVDIIAATLCALVMIVFAAGRLQAQQPARPAPAATLSAANAACNANNCVRIGLGNFKTVSVQLTGTCNTCTIQFEASNDGTNFVPVNLTPLNSATPATSATATGVWSGTVPTTYFQARISALTSGSFVTSVRATP